MQNDFLWTCRAGFEPDLAQELVGAKVLEKALVRGRTKNKDAQPPTFARQGMRIALEIEPNSKDVVSNVAALLKPEGVFAFHAWVPDSDEANRNAGKLDALRTEILNSIPGAAERERDAQQLPDRGDPVLQIAMAANGKIFAGVGPALELSSTWAGGRARMKVPSSAPSRASMKLAEAFSWLGFAPEKGDVCVDLGAAPGGWTWLLLQRGAKVYAIDRANMDPRLAQNRKLVHVRANAFEYTPEETVDWLFCDVVWKPLEVAQVLASWGKRSLARFMVANIKLPMKRRQDAVEEVRRVLKQGGWREIRTRQLYHDRDEITLAAWR